jgi:hypothetical protein
MVDFVCKGYDVSFKLDKGMVHCPKKAGLLHDPSGSSWPRNSVLIASFQRTGQLLPEEEETDEIDSFKAGDRSKKGVLNFPPRDLSQWKRLGLVERIDYTRVGVYADDYEHPFQQERGFWVFKEKIETVLYRRGRVHRLEMPEDAELSWRGFIFP